VLIEIRAFGLNRSEWFTRIGQSPSVKLPRVLGIECVGTVVSDPSGQIAPGQRVAAMMGGMGRQFDGSYAEYACVPSSNVFPLVTELPWEVLGALPEMLQTCHGSLHTGLEVKSGETLLIRGGTSSIGLATLAMANHAGLKVISTSRSEAKASVLKAAGADEVVIDTGAVTAQVRAAHPQGVDRVLELIGTTSLLDSLQCARPGGVVCMTGILGGQWELPSFRPMDDIPTAVRLTSYSGGAGDISRGQLQQYVSMVESGQLEILRGPVWRFDQLPAAHRAMDENRANGKMVVVVR
jgi:NADPH:quinone reductase-like Zn-dependent oxidoreductase